MKIGWNQRAGAAANARAQLPALAGQYFELGRALVERDGATPKELHAFRLATKHFRYTLELFEECYGPGLAARLQQLKKVQQFLGDINDCAAAGRLAAAVMPQNGPQRRRVEQFLRDRAAAKTAAFREHWRVEFDAPGAERRWRAYLERFARRP